MSVLNPTSVLDYIRLVNGRNTDLFESSHRRVINRMYFHTQHLHQVALSIRYVMVYHFPSHALEMLSLFYCFFLIETQDSLIHYSCLSIRPFTTKPGLLSQCPLSWSPASPWSTSAWSTSSRRTSSRGRWSRGWGASWNPLTTSRGAIQLKYVHQRSFIG